MKLSSTIVHVWQNELSFDETSFDIMSFDEMSFEETLSDVLARNPKILELV